METTPTPDAPSSDGDEQSKHLPVKGDDASTKEFWENLPVHPEAQKLLMMSDAEIDDLGRDIFETSLRESLDLFVDNREEANGSKGPFPLSLMDGRNRREAIWRLGHKSPLEQNTRGVRYHNAIKYDRKRKNWVPDCDPVKFILSKNVYRRHLTPEQKRDAIAAYIKADPQASNRAVAKKLNVSHHTVADVRASNGQNAHLTRMERAKAAIRDNPDASGRELAKIAGVGEATIRRAHKELAAAPEPETKPTEPADDASAKADAASSHKDLIDEVAADVARALNPIWQKWCANPKVTWQMFTAAIRRFIKTGVIF